MGSRQLRTIVHFFDVINGLCDVQTVSLIYHITSCMDMSASFCDPNEDKAERLREGRALTTEICTHTRDLPRWAPDIDSLAAIVSSECNQRTRALPGASALRKPFPLRATPPRDPGPTQRSTVSFPPGGQVSTLNRGRCRAAPSGLAVVTS